MIDKIENLFKEKFNNKIFTIKEISEDKTNEEYLCLYTNKFYDLDKIAKIYSSTWESCDMIFFTQKKIILVEFKNGKINSSQKPKIIRKFLNSYALLYEILQDLGISKDKFWQLKIDLIFVTSKYKNDGQFNYRQNIQQKDSLEILNLLENNIILYDFAKYKDWYFNEIYTPFCENNEFKNIMNKYGILLKEKQ